jgi:SSS family solute:Na+ symporter
VPTNLLKTTNPVIDQQKKIFMNLQMIDWVIVVLSLIFIVFMALTTKKYTKSVADFLAANRLGGRYLLTVSEGMVSLAAISTIAGLEMYYEGGFAIAWWMFLMIPATVILAMSGWVVYRFRETRAMTMGQFFEIRYSKKFRIFTGILAWVSGIINFGIFPAVGSRFFIYFCGFPTSFPMGGFEVETQPLIMFGLIATALFFTFVGGQIAVMVTDFLQGAYCNIGLMVIMGFFLWKFDWAVVSETFSRAPAGMSLINPFDTTKIPDFNIWYYLIGFLGIFFGTLSWQGSQGYQCSARSAHEMKMAKILANFRTVISSIMYLILIMGVYVAMNHESYAHVSQSVSTVLNKISTESEDVIRTQMLVPVALSKLLPVGLMGLFCAIMLSAFISTHDTYLHSWGSIFIQDVVLPFRKKPFTPKQHLVLLRFSICFVALFIFIFGLWFRQTQHIFLYMAITGAIYTGGIGAVIIGGLYWKKGTTTAAWVTMIYGSTVSIAAIITQQLWDRIYGEQFPINSQYITFFIMCSCVIIYVVISLFGQKTRFNIERMLYRGRYAHKDGLGGDSVPLRGLKVIGFTKDMPWKDKMAYLAVGVWFLGWLLVFIIGSVYHGLYGISNNGWISLWRCYIYMGYALFVVVTIWFLAGGIKDLKRLFSDLRVVKRNDLDDGMVVNHHNMDD